MGNVINEITNFLNSIEGWANEAAIESEPMPRLHVITIKKDGFTYVDKYSGGEPFLGLETLWKSSNIK